MDDMMRQVLAGWLRTAVAAAAGAMGWEQWVSGDVTTALVSLGVAVVMGFWSTLQKKDIVKA